MPRTYRLGERAAGVQATRERILEAAIELYTELGISATTMREIGLRADVAPGTLRAHFPNREALDRAMVDRLTAEAPLPELSLFDGAGSMAERLERLVRVTATFLEQSARIYRMWQRERLLTNSWLEAGARYGARWDALMRTGLGPLADDADAMAILRAVFHPEFFTTVREGRRTNEEAATLISSLLVPWFTARLAARQGPRAH